jgi:hypothetical protein
LAVMRPKLLSAERLTAYLSTISFFHQKKYPKIPRQFLNNS